MEPLVKMYISFCVAVKFSALTIPWMIIELVEGVTIDSRVTFQVLSSGCNQSLMLLPRLLQYQIRFVYHV